MGNLKRSKSDGSSDEDDASFIHTQAHPYDIELGSIVDELMVSQFQMEKLRSRLVSKFVQYVHKADVYYSEIDRKELSSSFEFGHKGKAYRITIDIEKSGANR